MLPMADLFPTSCSIDIALFASGILVCDTTSCCGHWRAIRVLKNHMLQCNVDKCQNENKCCVNLLNCPRLQVLDTVQNDNHLLNAKPLNILTYIYNTYKDLR